MAPNVSGMRGESFQESALTDRIELAGFSMVQKTQRWRSYPMYGGLLKTNGVQLGHHPAFMEPHFHHQMN